jgi:uncharacterized damage-inducible protein DinB
MYNKINDFLADWKFESETTVKILSALTDKSLTQKVYDEGRTLGYLSWHLAVTISEMFEQAKINLGIKLDELNEPDSSKEILDSYKKVNDVLVKYLSENWKDENLPEELPMYGQTWKKGAVLDSLIKHQTHHRGQITVLMRQAGLAVPGIYGPSKEEWKNMGMKEAK